MWINIENTKVNTAHIVSVKKLDPEKQKVRIPEGLSFAEFKALPRKEADKYSARFTSMHYNTLGRSPLDLRREYNKLLERLAKFNESIPDVSYKIELSNGKSITTEHFPEELFEDSY